MKGIRMAMSSRRPSFAETHTVSPVIRARAAHSAPLDRPVLVLISSVYPAIASALRRARALGSDIRAVYVETDPESTQALLSVWPQWSEGIPLLVLEDNTSGLTDPLATYLADTLPECVEPPLIIRLGDREDRSPALLH